MTGYERRRSSDSFKSDDWVDRDLQLYDGAHLSRQTSNESEFGIGMYEQRYGQREVGDVHHAQDGQLIQDRLALPEDWESHENDITYGHADEGARIPSHESQQIWNAGRRATCRPEFPWHLNDLLERAVGTERPTFTDPFSTEANARSGTHTPGSPSSMYANPRSSNATSNTTSKTTSGRSSMSASSTGLPVPRQTTEELVVGMARDSETTFGPTPAANQFTRHPIALGPALMLGLDAILEDSGYFSRGH